MGNLPRAILDANPSPGLGPISSCRVYTPPVPVFYRRFLEHKFSLNVSLLAITVMRLALCRTMNLPLLARYDIATNTADNVFAPSLYETLFTCNVFYSGEHQILTENDPAPSSPDSL